MDIDALSQQLQPRRERVSQHMVEPRSVSRAEVLDRPVEREQSRGCLPPSSPQSALSSCSRRAPQPVTPRLEHHRLDRARPDSARAALGRPRRRSILALAPLSPALQPHRQSCRTRPARQHLVQVRLVLPLRSPLQRQAHAASRPRRVRLGRSGRPTALGGRAALAALGSRALEEQAAGAGCAVPIARRARERGRGLGCRRGQERSPSSRCRRAHAGLARASAPH